MNEELVKDKLETHDKRPNNHGERLDKIVRVCLGYRS
ncbi:hypothetical protein B0P06_000248 [Clostridium saccharoperbutylacetonicum]|nr:hemolysin XhlA family protein [Clostridium saccharoperbutylacetonicum]NRT63630.1 hypothetical protein [Clostridium saccharoperbutylacetonicum]NSB26993.1 hypothetical protein [Clostridium saccharoperbutylacetonicum]NSB40477.1 hypothetical protein [Clostridium saccharoperbutylacetonicum]